MDAACTLYDQGACVNASTARMLSVVNAMPSASPRRAWMMRQRLIRPPPVGGKAAASKKA